MTRCGLEGHSPTGWPKRRIGGGRRHGYATGTRLAVEGGRRRRERFGCRPMTNAADGTLRWRGRSV
ncbi:MAG TPA: hypothetical protein VNC14_09620 [Lapillicoccus sp.]|nr:hypothetical protein [Lapillicoccus sp.]